MMRAAVVGALAFLSLAVSPATGSALPVCHLPLDTVGIPPYTVEDPPVRVGKPLTLTLIRYLPSVRDPITFKAGRHVFHPVFGPSTTTVSVTVPAPRRAGRLTISGSWVMDVGGGMPICTQSQRGTEQVLPATTHTRKRHVRRPRFAG